MSALCPLEQPSHAPAPLSIVYWTTSSGSTGRTFVAHAALTGIDLDSFPGYVDAAQRASLGVDHLDLVVSMDVREGIIRRGAVVAVSPERRRPFTMLFGGPLRDPVFDRSSSLIALWELPFARLGRVGDVVWETGGAVVGGAVGVIDGLARGDLLGAGGSAAVPDRATRSRPGMVPCALRVSRRGGAVENSGTHRPCHS